MCTTMFVVALPLLVASLTVHVPEQANPVERVVGLIRGLKSKIESDGKTEQKVYDKFACWCEETTARKAAAIEEAKSSIETLSKNIVELNGRLGSSTAEIAQLKKDIAETKESILKAEEMRSKEKAEFLKTKAALEQAIANLEKAIAVLGGLPQQSRKGFIRLALEERVYARESWLRDPPLHLRVWDLRSHFLIYSGRPVMQDG